jgi:3-methyladenine DNA glycosylase AlkD
MTVKEAMSKLEALGNEKVRARNKKQGAGDNQFGLQMGDIRKIAAPIKTDHKLAMELWDTGNIDARFLATLIMVPKQLTPASIEKLVGSIDFAYVADWFNNYVLKEFPQKEELREKWMNSKNPMIARAGWSLTSGRVARDPDGLDIPTLLDRIEKEMPKAKPEVQWTMNSTLANIGIKMPAHRKRAIAIGEKLGIYRDYPVSKGCTSPFAPIWIEAIVNRG